MKISVLSSKFQITIPEEICQSLGFQPGQRFAMAVKEGRIEFTPILTTDRLVGFLRDASPILFEREPDRELP